MREYRSDPALIQACRDGRQKAWNALVERYGRLVYSIPRRYGFGEADCEDVLQAAFTALFRSLETLKDDTRLSAWLITTTHRECWRLRRRQRRDEQASASSPASPPTSPPIAPAARSRHGFITDPIDETAPEEDAMRWERQHLVRQALSRLGGRCEQLLTALFRSTEPAYEAIARDMGMKVGSIGPTRARCFAKLEKILREMGFDEDDLLGAEERAGRRAAGEGR